MAAKELTPHDAKLNEPVMVTATFWCGDGEIDVKRMYLVEEPDEGLPE